MRNIFFSVLYAVVTVAALVLASGAPVTYGP